LTYGGEVAATVGEPMTVQATMLVDTATAASIIGADTRDDAPMLFAAMRLDTAPVMLLAADDDPPLIPVVGMPVTFTLDDLTCQAMTDENGLASCQITPTAVAQGGQLSASFAGTANYAASQASTPITVSQATPKVTLDGPSDPVLAGTPVTITATVEPVDGPGTVTFSAGPTTLCADVTLTMVDGVGTATCTTDALTVGADTVTAVFNGNDDYTTADETLTITVLAVPVEPQAPPETLPDTGFVVWTPVGAGLLLIIAGLCAARLGTQRPRRF
jgi:hypothetical protein